jgi:glycosyltransferase involved in cell wall biosynthesis
MPPMTRITVLFATLNGANTLPRMLHTLERLKSPTGGWKVIAVDNGSDDDSLRILGEWAGKLPLLIISEPRQGKNIALNAGLAHIEGEIVALTDDDVILAPDWLMAIESVAAQQIGYDIFGGAIYPVWEQPPPDWVLRCVPKSMYSCTDFQEGPIHPLGIWGPSMAVRSSLFRENMLDENIGPNGSSVYAKGSESSFALRAARSGHRCWHFEASPVGHIIRPYQLRPEWLLQRTYNDARGIRRLSRMGTQRPIFRVFGYPLRHAFGFIRAAVALTMATCAVAISRLFGDFEGQFRASSRLRYYQGDFAERCYLEKVRRGSARAGPKRKERFLEYVSEGAPIIPQSPGSDRLCPPHRFHPSSSQATRPTSLTTVFVTIAICTFNRAESLRRTLDSLVRMRVPGDLCWEIVIVHTSTDHTEEVISEYVGRLPVRWEFEPLPGKSNAQNRVIELAKGDYVLWTDDDVVVDAGWLTAYVEAFRCWPEAAVFGGRITPRYEPPVAKWVRESEAVLEGPYAIRNFGDHVYPLSADDEDHFPFGANWAIRAVEQRAFRYDPELGPAPNRWRASEETDVIQRVLGSGATGYWIPEAMVEHCIGRNRQTLRYIASYYESWGETLAFRNAAATTSEPFLFGIPQFIWPRLLLWGILFRLCRLVSPAPVWVRYLEAYSWNKGMRRYWMQEGAEMRRKLQSKTPAG